MVSEAFDVANQVQQLFNYVLGPPESFKILKQNEKQLEQPDSQLTAPNTNLLGQIKTSSLDGFDSFDTASQTLREYCSVAPQSLQNYINYFQQSKPAYDKVKNRHLLRFLDSALQKYGKGQKDVLAISNSFSQASRQLQTLIANLRRDYNENSPYFKNRLNRLIGEQSGGSEDSGDSQSGGGGMFGFGSSGSSGNKRPQVDKKKIIAQLKLKLEKILAFYVNYHQEVQKSLNFLQQANSAFTADLQWLGSRKPQIEASIGGAAPTAGEHNDEYHNAVIHSAEALIASCQEYLQKHP